MFFDAFGMANVFEFCSSRIVSHLGNLVVIMWCGVDCNVRALAGKGAGQFMQQLLQVSFSLLYSCAFDGCIFEICT
jgi:hypothetical protein